MSNFMIACILSNISKNNSGLKGSTGNQTFGWPQSILYELDFQY